MAIIQPPFSQDNARSSWEFELTSQFNYIDARSQDLLNLINTGDNLASLASLISNVNAIIERQDAALLFIQDDQPTPTYQQDFMWLQTNVNSNGDFSLWFCKEET